MQLLLNQFAWFYVKLLWRMFKVSKKKSSNDSILSLTSLIWQIFWKENTISKRFGWCPSKSSAHCRTLHFNVPYRLIWTWTTTARVRHVFIFLESENIKKEWWKSCLWKFITSIKSNYGYAGLAMNVCTYRNLQVSKYFLRIQESNKKRFLKKRWESKQNFQNDFVNSKKLRQFLPYFQE